MAVISDKNVSVEITEIGARINALTVFGTDIVLGFNSQDDYKKSGTYCGGTIGRVCNRIADGAFVLNGKKYGVSKNEGRNSLHGGINGFDGKKFETVSRTENSVTMKYVSADGEEGYPGELALTVKYTVAADALTIEYSAVSDADTLWCPTNHAYFNLDGERGGNCLNNILRINGKQITPVDDALIPTGDKMNVIGTIYDFTECKRIGKDINNAELAATKGYDHNYILDGEHAVHAESSSTGIQMDVYTDLPCMQFYSGGQITEIDGKSGKYGKWQGFCLEPQYCPNAVNMRGFDKPIIKKGETVAHYIRYKFAHNGK